MWLKSSFSAAVNPSASPQYYMGLHPLLNLQQTPSSIQTCLHSLKKFLILRSKPKNGNRLFIYIFKHSYKKRTGTYIYFNQAGHTFQILCYSLFLIPPPTTPIYWFHTQKVAEKCVSIQAVWLLTKYIVI